MSERGEIGDRDYFRSAYARKLEDEKRALELAAALADALWTCKSELQNYVRGELGDANSTVIDAIEDAVAALRLAGRLP